MEIGLHQGGTHRILVCHAAAGLLERAVDQRHGIIGLERIGRRHRVELILIGGDKRLVLRVVEIGRPVRTAEKSERCILLRRKRRFIHREGGQERDRVRQPRLAKLLDEVHTHAAGQKNKDGIRLGGSDLRQLGRIIELAKRDIDFVRDLALEGAFKAGERILASLVIRRDEKNLLHPGVLGVFAQHLVHLVILVGRDKEIRIALLAGKGRCAGVRADQDAAPLRRGLHDRGENVGEYRADDKIDLVAIHHRFDLVDRNVRLELVVLNQHLDLAPAQLAPQRLDREIDAVAELLSKHCRRPRQRRDQADLQFLLRAGRRGHEREQCYGAQRKPF